MVAYRRMYNEQCALRRGAEAMASEYKGSRDTLQDALRRSEVERTDLQTKLLRVGYGYPPFPEGATSVAESPNPDPHSKPEAGPVEVSSNMTDAEVQAAFVREGAELYGNNLRAITRHVETRQAEYYQYRNRQPILTPAEAAAAEAVAADLQAAIAEGHAAAERVN